MSDLADVRTIARYVITHIDAGRNASDPKLRKDLTTLGSNIDKVLDALGPPATQRQQLAYLVRNTPTKTELEAIAVSLATDVKAAAAEVGTSAIAAADRVIVVVGQVRTDLAAALAKIEELIAAGSADEEALTEAKGILEAADAKIDSIEPAPVEPV